jgi:hypothetical protein
MNYVLIKGIYHVVGYSPDGDSIKFTAVNPDNWKLINSEFADEFAKNFAEDNGAVQLRLQGVDALETHYAAPKPTVPADLKGKTSATLKEPPYMSLSQPSAMAKGAAEYFMGLLGITEVKWRNSGRGSYITQARMTVGKASALVKEKGKDGIPGFIVTGDIEKNGRPIAWVFAGDPPIKDGATISTDQLVELADKSANYQLLRSGMIYPLYYMTLAGALRRKLDEAVQAAQAAAKTLVSTPQTPPNNIWQLDRSTTGVTLATLKAITDDNVVYPDLFRRLLRHYQTVEMNAYWAALRSGATSITEPTGFDLGKLFDGANPYVFVISDQDFVRMADVFEINGDSLRMKKSPADLVFLSW